MTPPPLEPDEKTQLRDTLKENGVTFDQAIERGEGKLNAKADGLCEKMDKRAKPVETVVTEPETVTQETVVVQEKPEPVKQEPDHGFVVVDKDEISIDSLKTDANADKPANLGNGRVSFLDSVTEIFKSVVRELVTGLASVLTGDPLAELQKDYDNDMKDTFWQAMPLREAVSKR